MGGGGWGGAQRFGVEGVAGLEAMEEMVLVTKDSKKLEEGDVRVLGDVLRRPLVAARLVTLNLG